MAQTKTTKEENEAIKRYVVRFLDRQENFKKEEAEYKSDKKGISTNCTGFYGEKWNEQVLF